MAFVGVGIEKANLIAVQMTTDSPGPQAFPRSVSQLEVLLTQDRLRWFGESTTTMSGSAHHNFFGHQSGPAGSDKTL